MAEKNVLEIGSVRIFVRSSTRRRNREPFSKLDVAKLREEIAPIELNNARGRAYRDAYGIAFSAAGDTSIPLWGDMRVTRSMLHRGLLRVENDRLARGKSLPDLFRSGKVHVDSGKSYQAVLEGEIDLSRDCLLTEVDAVRENNDLDATTRKQLVDARIGQGRFRDDLFALWNARCALTGCRTPEVLRASHIKPWRTCSNSERLDPDNGILLAASIDALFDKHMISFDEVGNLLVSQEVPMGDREILNLAGVQSLRFPNENAAAYMRTHREVYHSKNK